MLPGFGTANSSGCACGDRLLRYGIPAARAARIARTQLLCGGNFRLAERRQLAIRLGSDQRFDAG